MPDSSKFITKLQLGIITLWLSFTVAAFSYFVNQRLVDFDSSGKLTHIEQADLAEYLATFIEQSNTQAILHFSSNNCDCQQYSEQHIQSINTLASKHDFKVHNITLTSDNILPATPSVALIDETGDVIYFGPYGEGASCSQTSGYAQTMLNNFVKGYKANIVIKNAKGCYCEL